MQRRTTQTLRKYQLDQLNAVMKRTGMDRDTFMDRAIEFLAQHVPDLLRLQAEKSATDRGVPAAASA